MTFLIHRNKQRKSWFFLLLFAPLLLILISCEDNYYYQSINTDPVPSTADFGALYIQIRPAISPTLSVGCATPDTSATIGGVSVPCTMNPLGSQLGWLSGDSLMNFKISLDAVQLNPGSRDIFSGVTEIDLATLQGEARLVRPVSLIEAGEFSSVTLTFSSPKITNYGHSTLSSSWFTLKEEQPPLVNATVTKDVSLAIGQANPQLLLIDFDMVASLITDSQGNITGVDPAVALSTRDVLSGVDDVDELGIVQSISRDTPEAVNGDFFFTSFTSCETYSFKVNENTLFLDYDDIDSVSNVLDDVLLPPLFESFGRSQFVQVIGDIETYQDVALGRTFDRMRAISVELDQLAESSNRLFKGQILSLEREIGAPHKVIGFTMHLRQLAPCSAPAPSSYVNLTKTLEAVEHNRITNWSRRIDYPEIYVQLGNPTTTTFHVDEEDFSISSTLFDGPEDLEIGQNVVVDPSASNNIIFTPENISLDKQVFRGAISGIPTSSTFNVQPSVIFYPTPITYGTLPPQLRETVQSISVETGASTVFQGVTSTSSLMDNQRVAVYGFLLLDGGQFRFLAHKVLVLP